MFKKRKKKKEKRKRNQHRPRRPPPVAVFDTRLPEHASRSSITVLCLSVSLQGQLANDDSNDKEEHAECQDTGAQTLFPHGRAHQGRRVRGSHRGHLSLPQSIILLPEKKGQESKQLRVARDFSGKTDSAMITHRGPLLRLCLFTNRQNEAPWQVKPNVYIM